MTVRLRGALPAEEMNGLSRIEEALTRDPKTKRIVVGVVDVAQRRDHGDGVFEPTVEFLQVELVEGKLRERALKILRAAHQSRTGAKQLDGFAEDDTLDEDAEPVEAPPATVPPVPGPRFSFEPEQHGKWAMVYRDEDGGRLAYRSGLGVQADLTLGRAYSTDEIDALGDHDLSVLARTLEREVEEATWEAAQPEQVSQYVAPDGEDEAAAYAGEPDENADGDEPADRSPIFSDGQKETTDA